jgi:hypothetical protein
MSEPKKQASVFPVTFVVGSSKGPKKSVPKTVIRVSSGCCVEKPKAGGSK